MKKGKTQSPERSISNHHSCYRISGISRKKNSINLKKWQRFIVIKIKKHQSSFHSLIARGKNSSSKMKMTHTSKKGSGEVSGCFPAADSMFIASAFSALLQAKRFPGNLRGSAWSRGGVKRLASSRLGVMHCSDEAPGSTMNSIPFVQ